MSRTDRLMHLMDVLRRLPPPVTARRLAAETGVSQRQLYRDIATLRAGGALIDGEAGVGYVLTEDPTQPPQSFSRLEIEALLLAVQSLDRIGDTEMTNAAREATARIRSCRSLSRSYGLTVFWIVFVATWVPVVDPCLERFGDDARLPDAAARQLFRREVPRRGGQRRISGNNLTGSSLLLTVTGLA